MKKLLIFPLFLGGFLFSQTKEDSVQFSKIAYEVLNNSTAYENLRELTKNIGPRLSGSEAYEKSVDWAVQKLKEAGATKVWKQEVQVPVWVRGKESLHVKGGNGNWKSIKMLSLGNSEGTNGKDLEGEILTVNSMEELNSLPDSAVKDKIIFMNVPFPQEVYNTMDGYRIAGKARWMSPSIISKKGGKAVIVRSISTAFDNVPHTGALSYSDGIKKIPAIAIGPKSAEELQKVTKNKTVIAKINSNCGMKGEKTSYSVIGDLPGTESDRLIAVSGHLDSWDIGEGAHDDGSGIVQSIEVLRAFKKMGIKNKNTIRVICYANEENGTMGGKTYLEYVQKSGEKHIFGIESDSGGFSPRGISLEMEPEKIAQIESWKNLFLPYGIYDFSGRRSGSDIGYLAKINVPVAGLVPDTQRYFDIHHAETDVFENINKRELLWGASTMAQLIYMIDRYW